MTTHISHSPVLSPKLVARYLTAVSVLLAALLLSLSSTPAQAATSFYRFPVFYGNAKAPNTIILYNNIECGSCRGIWPAVTAALPGLDAENVRLIIQGGGKTDAGHKTMLVAMALAEQNPELGREFMTAAFADEKVLSNPVAFATTLAEQKRRPLDVAKLEKSISPANNTQRVEGKAAIQKKYSLRQTPSFIINGVVYTGPINAEKIKEFMQANPPVPALP